MAIEFNRDVVVITGAGNGLGREYALLLASLGARVVVNDIGGSIHGEGSDDSTAAAVVREITDAGGSAIADTHDGASVDGAQALIQTALDSFGQIDAVIANAGILRDKSFHKMSDEDFWKVVDVHLRGTVNVFKTVYPHMREQAYGRLVSTTSASALFGNFGQTNYAAAKLGIVGLARVIALEGKKHNILSNVIAPAARTRLTQDLPEENAAKANPKLIAPLAAYMCHRSTTMTGEVISAGMGRFGRVRIGVTAGIYCSDPTPEWVAESMPEILADDEMIFPAAAFEEVKLMLAAAGA